jgi:ferredoxin-NADP reductase
VAHRRYKIVRKVAETPNTLSVFLRAEDERPLDTFRAGQHLTFVIPRVGERDYVLSAFSPEPKIYRITVSHGEKEQESRSGSAYWLQSASKGDVVSASGPSGSFHLPSSLDTPIVILSKDIGEAVLTAIAEELAVKAPRHRVVFLHSAFNSSTFALKGKLGSLKADLQNATWNIWFSKPRQIDREGKEYDFFGELDVATYAELLSREDFDVYICGPDDFVGSTEAKLRELKLPFRRILMQGMGRQTNPLEVQTEQELPALEPRLVKFSRTGNEATWRPEEGTLLEFAERLGIIAPFSCRTGMCGMCAQRVISGEVAKVRETSAKTREHYQLLCSNIPLSDLEIDL